MVRSRIFTSQVYHSRLYPIKHTFQYNVYYYVLDLDELERGELDSTLFGHNKYRPVAVWDTDYLGNNHSDGSTTIREKVISLYKTHLLKENKTQLEVKEIIQSIGTIELVTMARYFNKSFNPVNFYYCYHKDRQDDIVQVVVEINNTFGETHLYFPTESNHSNNNNNQESLKYTFKNSVNGEPYLKYLTTQKDFHVSPFNSLDGSYDFCFSDTRKCFDIRINLISNVNNPSLDTYIDNNNNNDNNSKAEGNQVKYLMMTRLWSTPSTSLSSATEDGFKGVELTTYSISKVIIKYPITTFLTLPRILYQAGQLHWSKGLKVYAKPNPPALNTPIIIPPSSSQQAYCKFFVDFLGKFSKGHFIITLPDQSAIHINNNKKQLHQSSSSSSSTSPISTLDNNDPVPENLYSDRSNATEPVEIRVNNYDFFTKIYVYHFNNVNNDRQSSGISAKALGMAYMVNDFTCDSLPSLISLVCDLTTSFYYFPTQSTLFGEQVQSTKRESENEKKWGWISKSDFQKDIFKYFLNQESYSYNCGLLKGDNELNNIELTDSNIVNDYINNNYHTILQKLDITNRDDNIKILVFEGIGYSFTKYLLKQLPNCKIFLVPTSPQANCNNRDNYNNNTIYNNNNNNEEEVDFNARVTIMVDDQSFSLEELIVTSLFDAAVSIEGLEGDFSFTFQNTETVIKVVATDSLKPGSKFIIQTLTGPFHPYQESDIKPTRYESLTNKHRLSRVMNDLESRTWSLFTNFSHDPFQLENRYVEIMQLLVKGFCNGHIYDKHSEQIPNLSSDLMSLLTSDSELSNLVTLVDMDNIGDNYQLHIVYWMKQLNNNKSTLLTDIQTVAMRLGCQLKLNETDILEIYNAIQYHLSYLLACFKSVWSASIITLQRK